MELRPTGLFEPSGVLIICCGSKEGKKLQNNAIVPVVSGLGCCHCLPACILLVAICFMLSGSGIKDEVNRVLISLRGLHALIRL